MAEKPCKVLAEDTMTYLAENAGEDAGLALSLVPQSPLGQVMETALAGLDDKALTRIRSPLADRFGAVCMTPESKGFDKDITVGEVFDRAVKSLELNPDAPRWGLVDIPEVDFRTHTCKQVMDMVSESVRLSLNPVNDFYRVAYEDYAQSYDLSDPGSPGKLQLVMSYVVFECNDTKPMADLIDRFAAEQGLTKKK
ncbi:hypothetical protein K1T73_16915 [Roseovarius sp. SCSIO 43702]|uniref:hypothetical protein n=1 Tax=Roseovarius sp. SCSIO 43702 TaxID=2823043 RepID=UPI001C72A204|nr:hypothetical protein [Roseovarius sp. SCSIO 43702]QYX56691.1 hypothetical protein K1T73_16915 [Roseovarius sp. SCSIO 43702]